MLKLNILTPKTPTDQVWWRWVQRRNLWVRWNSRPKRQKKHIVANWLFGQTTHVVG